MIYDKSYKHNAIYNSYNAKVVVITIKNLALENTSQSCSVVNELKFDVTDPTQKYLLDIKFAVWHHHHFIVIIIIIIIISSF